ncbi:MAG: WYL domain-containing protein [bacterium]|nr:WYL domain-containing protein [bacterium]
MHDITALQRYIQILNKLANRGKVTVEDLYNEFDRKVSVRTLQRDLVRLSDAGVPLANEPGIGRELVWSIEPRYLKFVPVSLGLDEFFSLKLLQCAADIFTGTPIGSDIEGAIAKIKQLVPSGVIQSTNSIEAEGEYLGVHHYGYIDYRQKGDLLRTFLWAAVNREVCEVEYRKPGDAKPNTFDAHPYTLLYHKGAFYGIVYQPKHQGFIYLLIHRMSSLKPQGKLFDRDDSFNLTDFLKGAFGILRDEPEEVAIQFFSPVANTIRERIWHATQQLEEQKDGSVILKMKVAANAELAAWILYYGQYARVISPQGLRKKLLEDLTRAIGNYENNP